MNLLDRIAYDTGGYTVQEIISSFCKKILEIIDLVNKNEEVCDEARTIIENIRNEVVPDLVDDIIKEMQDNGYFDKLVNVNLIENLRTEITTLLNQAITDYTTRLDNVDSQLDTIAYNFDVDFPRLEGETSDNARFKRAIASLNNGDKLLLDNKIYQFNIEKIIINKQITIEGKKKPLFNGTNLVNGTVLKSVGFVIEENNITIKNLGLDSPEVDNTFQANTKSVFNILIENCSAVAYAHSYLFESYNGAVYNVLVDKCESYKSIHGFISKAINVTFSNCKAFSHRSYGFGNIADNIQMGNANNRNNRVINCYADSCGTGFVCYSRDTKSDNNVNEIYLKELVWYGNYAYDCDYGYVIGDINESPSGQTYNKVINVLMTDCQEQGGSDSYSLAIGRTSKCKVTNSTFSVGVIYKSEYTPDCIIETSGNVQLDYPQKHQDITITNSTLTFQTCDPNPIISVSSASYQEIANITCNLTNIQTLTIKLSDNNVALKSGALGLMLGRTYFNKDSFVVLKKNSKGKWYELYGYTSFTG